MMRSITIFVAIVSLLSGLPQASAHVRLYQASVKVKGSREGDSVPNIPVLAYDKSIPELPNKNAPLVSYQFDTTVFSSPAIPADAASPYYRVPRRYMANGCGGTINNIHNYWSKKNPADYSKYGAAGSWGHRIKNYFMKPFDPETLTQTANLTQARLDAGPILKPKIGNGDYLQIHGLTLNEDGGGPFKCRVDTSGTGQNFDVKAHEFTGLEPIRVWGPVLRTCNSPGGMVKDCVGQKWFMLVKLPANLQCHGEYGRHKNICLIRCENEAVNGPFGGCVPFQIDPPPGAPVPKPTRVIVNTKKPEPTPKYRYAGYDVGKNNYDEGAKEYY
ncbi:uncharacterized protein DFL_000730 [Arthrobotrys flagrans]|uniref:Uncharacterized protein n=1 Tax=Arthrobotrys flagrans TaxID=97331 RepID=A0A437AFH6_ARTFL|nr:hypothetical protein DFL_000730 [Arthrobotrys flagrans]